MQKRRCTVQQDGMALDDGLQRVPDLGAGTLDHLTGRLDVVGLLLLDQVLHDEGLEQLEGHLLGQAALIHLQLGADDDNGTAGVVNTLAQQVLAEAALLAFQHIGQGLQRTVVGAGDRAAAAAVIDQGIDSFLQHTLLVAHDDVGRPQLQQTAQTVVAVDDTAIQIVQVGGGETAAIQLQQRAQIRRDHGDDRHDHPLGALVALQEALDALETLQQADALLAVGMLQFLAHNRIYGFRNSKFKEDGEEYDIIVRLDEKYRSSLTEIENILIIDGHGEKIRLKELGEIKEYFSPPNIERKSKQRILKVSITPAAGVALGDIAQASQQIIDNLEDVPQDVSLYIGGNYEDQQESFSSLIWLLLLSLMLVYIVMAAQFESFKMPFIIMLAIPFAFTGVILALLLTNTTLSIVAALGAIMLVGIVTKNGIVLIDFINLMRERGIRLYDAIAQACRSRLRPVLMTSLTTILGMVPMAISAGEGSETWRPMGIAVIGGMVFSTIITMIIVPAVYAAMDKSGSRDKKKALAKEFKFMKDFDPEKDLPKK